MPVIGDGRPGSSGVTVSNTECRVVDLEGLLLTHPAVADAAVIGIQDDECGEIPKAFISLKPGVEATAEEIQAFVADQVATFKQIRLVELIPEIPKSASGKILRRELRDR